MAMGKKKAAPGGLKGGAVPAPKAKTGAPISVGVKGIKPKKTK